ncbi:MAG: HAD family phosphatase [Balneolaceae bacterium]
MNTDFGVIFDMDGVLTDSNPVHKETIERFCKKYNKEVSEDFLLKHVFGRTNQEWIPDLFGNLSGEEVSRLADEKEAMFRDIFDPLPSVIPGLFDFLDQLDKHNIKSVVATSAPRENADFILSALSIENYFDTVLDSSHVDKGKPDPQVYLKAADAIGYPPEKCIVFEDSLSGVEAGIRAGAKVIGITSTHTAEEMENCDKVVDDFTELDFEILEGLINQR